MQFLSVNNLNQHISVFPDQSHDLLRSICRDYTFNFHVKKSRQTKLGDFRYPIKNEVPVITVNRDENKYRVLMTFLHELAHLIVYLDKGRSRNPHGPRWKQTYSNLLDIFYQKNIFPEKLKESVYHHILKPKASSYADVRLLKALREYDAEKDTLTLIELPENQLFRLNNGKVFEKLEKRRSRILCREIDSKKKYLIHGHAEVVPVNNL